MTEDAALRELEAERDRLSVLTRKGVGMPAAGMIFWIAVAFMLRWEEPRTALVICS